MVFESLRLALLGNFLAQSSHLLGAPLLFFPFTSFLLQPIEALFFTLKPIMQIGQHLSRFAAVAYQATNAHVLMQLLLLLMITLQCLTQIMLLFHDC